MSTSALIGRSPMAVSRRCSHSGEGPLRTSLTSRSAKPRQSDSVAPKSSLTVIGHAKLPSTGLIAGSLNVPTLAAARSRAMPCTPVQSGRFGVRLISMTGSSRPAQRA